MRTTLTILLFGLVILPMTFLSPSIAHANGSGPEKSLSKKNEEFNHSDLFSLDPNSEALASLMDFTVTASSETVSQNQSFCVQVSVTNFTDILGMEFLMTFDPSKLRFDAIQNLNLAGLTQSSFGTPGSGANPANQLKVSWFDQNVSGVSVPDGTTVFEVCFTALTDDVTDNIQFSSPEIIDSNENIIPFVGESGTITVGDGGSGSGSGSGNNSGFTVTVSDGMVQQNQQICVEVSVDAFTDILGMELIFNYDPSQLRFDAVQNLNLAGLTQSAFGTPGVGANPLGQLKLSWFDQNVSGVTVANGTIIFEICFTALTDDSSQSITMSDDEIIDVNENIIPFTGQNGTITIGDGGNGSGSGNGSGFTVTVADGMVQQNQQICVGVSVDAFTNILGTELIFNYDPSKLRYDGVQNLNLAGLNQSAFGEPGVGANPLGQLKLSWFDQNVTGVTIPDGTTIFEMCFTALTDNTTDQITMSEDEIIDGNENIISFTGVPGTITIGDGNGNGNGNGNSDDFTLTVADGSVQQGQEVCLPITVDNFDDILGIELTLNYNPTKLQYSKVQNFNLDGLSQSAFGEPGVGANPAGEIKLSWFDQNVSGISLPDGTTIFEVCFTALVSDNTDQITFSDDEIIDSGENIVTLNGVPGTVTIGMGNTGGTGDFEITMANATVNPNDNFCLGVSVNNFTDLAGLEFTIDYDPNLLTFTEVKDFDLPDLNATAFGLPGMGANQEGTIPFSWFDMGGAGVSVADGTTIFQICFDAPPSPGTAIVDFLDLEGIGNNNNIITSLSNEGTVTIQGTTGGSDELTFTIGSGTVAAGEEICVPVTVNNFDNILGMEYTINYDDQKFEFVEVKDFNLQDLSASSFGLPGVGANQPGDITLSWFDQAVTGISVPDGTTIFVVCLRAIGTGSGSVSISQTGLEITDGDENLVTPVLENGTINIDGLPPTTDLQIIFGNVTGENGDVICVPVSVNNFDDVLGLEFVMGYDPTALEYQSIQNLNLDQLSMSSFGVPGVGVNPPGEIKISWFDQQVQGVSVPDNTTIFDLCFTILGANGTSTIVDIDDSLPIEIIDSNEEFIDNQSVAGTVMITNAAPLVLASPAVITGATCNAGSDGSIDIEISGGSNTYTYAWSGGQNTQDVSGLSAGQYTVTVTDSGTNQTLTQTFTVNEPPAVLINSTNETDVTCTGESTGAIQISASGGTGTLSYTWDNSLPATANQNALAAGVYSVTVSDQNNCTTSISVTIDEPAQGLALSSNLTNETCGGQNDGAITLMVSGGTGGYSYNWGNGLTGDVATQNNLGAGTYPVTVSDASGCTLETSIELQSDPSVAISDVVPTFIDENTNGAVSLSVNGGQTPYTYQWDGPESFSASSQNISNLTQTGEYCFTVTDANGCEETTCVMILERLRFSDVSIDNSCNQGQNGLISISVAGGLGPYTYSWSNGMTTSMVSDLSAGNYTVTVTDAMGNTFNGQFPVGEFEPIIIQASTIPVRGDENNSNGEISLMVNGGNGGYTYQWDNGGSTSTISDLAAGQYCVTVTSQSGCISEACFDVEVELIPLSFTSTGSDLSCNGDTDGSATIQIVGGSPPYAITFADNVMMSSNDGNVTRDNLPGGEMPFVITDANNTTVAGNVVVTEPAAIVIESVDILHDVDAMGCTGEITIQVSGGSPGYSVQWNSPNTGFQIIGLCEGNYIPTVIDANGCQVAFDPIELNTFSVQESISNVECSGDTNGGINLTASGGSGAYTYRWEDNEGQLLSETDSIADVPPGMYSVTISESSGNTITRTYEVGTTSSLTASVSVDSDFRGFGVSCPEATDGILSATAQDGAGDYIYTWMQGDNIIGEGQVLNNAAAGSYTLEVMDANGCVTTQEAVLTAPAGLQLDGFVNDLTCVGDRDGSITVVASGGSGSFNYRWSNDRNGPTINSLISGNYTVTITDGNNCEVTSSFDVGEPAPIQVAIETTPATDGCNGSARATVSGGAGPYLYRWNSNSVNTDSVITGLCPGDYRVVVTDANGCASTPEFAEAEVLDRRFPCMDFRTVISPDGDGLNEEFLINCIEELNNNRVMIFNRWGQLVFETENYQNDWRAETANGTRLPDGAYYYILEYTDTEGNFVQTKGSITVLREE